MAQSIFFDVVARDRASSTFTRVGKSSGQAESRLKKFGRTAGQLAGLVGVASFGAGAISFFKDSISEASDLNETLSKSRIIFGDHANEVERWASKAAGSIGLSKQAALEARASFGDMFSQLGLGAGRATKMSGSVVQLAADLGSFNNLSTDDVLERIAGGFRGEYDALQKVIPNISAARVQQEALRQTHKKSVTDLTAAEKAEATLAIVRKDGARATGDFARTSGGLANQQKILHARTKDLEAAVGKGLLPVTTQIVSATSDFIAEMQDGTGAGGQFVDMLSDAASVGKTAVKILDAIPGPVKKFGVEGLIAYGVLRKLSSGLTSAGASMAMPIARTKQMYAEMTYAETRMQKVKTASYAMGGALRNLAGAGGMIALAKSTQDTSLAAVGLERTLGGAAVGLSTGGPFGAAIGGTVGLLTTMWQALHATGHEATVSLPPFKEYASTLDGVAASAGRATRALAFQRLEQSGLLKATRALGLTDREAVQAVLGNASARTKLANAMVGTTRITDAQKKALQQETGALGASRLAQLQQNVAIAGSAAELKKAKAALAAFMKEPASKRVAITGIETATAQLVALRRGLREALGLTRDLNNAGAGGTGNLLTAPLGNGRGSANQRGAAPTIKLAVDKALSQFGDALSKATDRLSSLKDTRSGFLSTFSSDSIFGADLSAGGGVGALLDFQQKQADQASQLMADIQNLAGRGLSKSLISQLQAQGTSGALQLHALAGGSGDQIAQLNALNAQTQASLQAAGLFAGNTVRGGNINSDIASAAAEDARLERLLRKLRHLQGDDVVIINLDTEQIIKAIKKRNRRKGVASADL